MYHFCYGWTGTIDFCPYYYYEWYCIYLSCYGNIHCVTQINTWDWQQVCNKWSVVKVTWHKPHHCRTRMVQSYLPRGPNAHLHLIRGSWAHPTQPAKRHVNRFTRFCTADIRESIFHILHNGRRLPPLYVGTLFPHATHGSLCPPKSTSKTTFQLVQLFLQGSRLWQTDQ